MLRQNFAQIHEEEEGKEKFITRSKKVIAITKNKRLNWLASIKKGHNDQISPDYG